MDRDATEAFANVWQDKPSNESRKNHREQNLPMEFPFNWIHRYKLFQRRTFRLLYKLLIIRSLTIKKISFILTSN